MLTDGLTIFYVFVLCLFIGTVAGRMIILLYKHIFWCGLPLLYCLSIHCHYLSSAVLCNDVEKIIFEVVTPVFVIQLLVTLS